MEFLLRNFCKDYLSVLVTSYIYYISEQEADAEEERLRKERERQQKQDVMTLGETREQISNLDNELSQLKAEKHQLFLQLKKVLNEDDRRRQLIKETRFESQCLKKHSEISNFVVYLCDEIMCSLAFVQKFRRQWEDILQQVQEWYTHNCFYRYHVAIVLFTKLLLHQHICYRV